VHRMATLSVTLLLALAMGPSAAADPARATAASLGAVLERAKGGDTIVLAPDEFQDVAITGRHWSPAIVIDARAAKLSNWLLKDVSGVTIGGGLFHLRPPGLNLKTGEPAWGAALRLQDVEQVEIHDATFQGPGRPDAKESGAYGDGYGVSADKGRKVTLARNTFSGFKVGAVIANLDGFQVVGNTFSAMRADGMDVAMAHNGLIEGNHCFGTVIRTTEHPDCIQMWSRPVGPPTSDIVIRKNKVEGPTQGIGLFNHVRNGVDDGGFDRIVIEDNDVEVSAPQGIALIQGRESVVRNNRVRTLPGAIYRASLNVKGGDVKRCGNVVEPGAGKVGVKDPGC
jgi:hypothetical protein